MTFLQRPQPPNAPLLRWRACRSSRAEEEREGGQLEKEEECVMPLVQEQNRTEITGGEKAKEGDREKEREREKVTG